MNENTQSFGELKAEISQKTEIIIAYILSL